MRYSIFSLISLFLVAQNISAAPYYQGVGCNEEGTRCTFGTPSERVLVWSQTGTVQELGERCEGFITQIENRKQDIAKSMAIDIQYRNFTYRWSNEIQSDGRAKIICRVELHSELENVKLEFKTVKKFNWVCENKNSEGVCAHYFDECEAAKLEALKGENVLDAAIVKGGALFQGQTCNIVIAKIK